MADEFKQISGGNDILAALKADVLKVRNKPMRLGKLHCETANKWIDIGKTLPDPKYFYHKMIVQFEINVIFSAANTGKSLLLVQIAEDIARTEKVLIVDCELSTKQFQLRYTNPETGGAHLFPEKFLRAEIDPELLDDVSLEDAIFGSVEQAAKAGIKVICIDNLTFICTEAEKAEVTIKFMRRLIKLKIKYGLTLIIIAHTKKRDQSRPITQDDLSGSSKLMALIDDALAIGISAQDSQLRYVKTVKFRNKEYPYPAENVGVYRIEKRDSFTGFVYQGRSEEDEHLRCRSQFTEVEDLQELLNLEARHMTISQIAEATGVPRTTVHRKLKKAKGMGLMPVATGPDAPSPESSHSTSGTEQVECRETGGDMLIQFFGEEKR